MGRGDRKKPLPALAPVKSRAKPPRNRGRFAKPAEDARNTALDGRLRQFGGLCSPDARQAISGQHMGAAIGMVMQREAQMQREPPIDVPRLWTVWQAWCTAERTYSMRINSQTGSPKGSSFAAIPERIETDTGHTVDTRTPDQRDADAIRGWMIWRGYLGQLDAHETTALHHARREDGPPIWADCRPTVHGQVALDALKRLADVVEGK